MALTGKFLADFESFYTAVDKADVKLRELDAGAGKVSTSLNRMADSFSGRKTIQDASLMAKAIEGIGGASTLTAKEQARANATLNEAIEKYRALGREVPPLIQKIADETKNAGHASVGWVDGIKALGGSFVAHVAEGILLRDAIHEIFGAVEEATKALPELIAHTAETGNKLYEMSLKTGASVENLSRLRYVASQTGLDFESFGTTLFKMEKFLGGTGAAAVTAEKTIGQLGLSFQALKNEKPDEAFIDIIAALEKIPNRADQAAAGAAIFGKGWKDMAGLAQESIHELLDEADKLGLVMSTETAAAAHAAEVGFKALSMQVEAVGFRIGEAFLPAIIGLEQNLTAVFTTAIGQANTSLDKMGGSGGFLSTVAAAMGTGNNAIAAQVKLYEALRDTLIGVVRYGIEPSVTAFGYLMVEVNAAKVVLGDLMQILDGVRLAFLYANLETAKARSWTTGIFDAGLKNYITETDEAIGRLMLSMKQRGDRLQQDKKNEQDWAGAAKASIAQIEAALTSLGLKQTDVARIIADFAAKSRAASGGASVLDPAEDNLKKATKAAGEFRSEIGSIAKDVLKVDEKIGHFGDKFADALAKIKDRAAGVDIREKAQEWAEAMADPTTAALVLADQALKKELGGVIDATVLKFGSLKAAGVGSLDAVATSMGAWATITSGLPLDTFKVLGDSIKPVPPQVRKATDSLNELAASLTQLAQIGGSAFGPILKSASALVSGLDAAAKANERWGGSAGIASAMFSDESTKTEKFAAGVASSAAIIQGAMNVWASSANDASKAAGAFHGAMSGAQAGAVFGPYGAAVGAAAGAIAGMIHTLSAGRRAVEDFAKSFDTVAAGSGFDELHAKMLKLGDEGERLWIKLTQQTKKGDKAAAALIIDEISKALKTQQENDPEANASSAGYKTRADLEETAKKAKAVWAYMVESGKYTADEIAKAFKASEDAQVSMWSGAATAAHDAVAKIDTELKGLQDAVSQEAPELDMGSVERQQRSRIEQLLQERIQAEATFQDEKAKSEAAANAAGAQSQQDAAQGAHEQTQAWYDAHPLNIPWRYRQADGDNPPGPAQTPSPTPSATSSATSEPNTAPGFATGTPGLGYVDFGKQAPAWLHGREAVIPENRVGSLADQIAARLPASGAGSSDVYVSGVTIQSATDNPEELAAQIWEAVRRGGRPRERAFRALGLV